MVQGQLVELIGIGAASPVRVRGGEDFGGGDILLMQHVYAASDIGRISAFESRRCVAGTLTTICVLWVTSGS